MCVCVATYVLVDVLSVFLTSLLLLTAAIYHLLCDVDNDFCNDASDRNSMVTKTTTAFLQTMAQSATMYW